MIVKLLDTTINDKPKITEQITGKEDDLLEHGMVDTTSMTTIKKVTGEQLRDGDNSICYSTAETCIPPLLGVEEAYN